MLPSRLWYLPVCVTILWQPRINQGRWSLDTRGTGSAFAVERPFHETHYFLDVRASLRTWFPDRIAAVDRLQVRFARWCGAAGVQALLGSFPRRTTLIALNYHRIGVAASARFDSGVFTASAEAFVEQVGEIKSRYLAVTLDQAVEIVAGRFRPSRPAVLITFDDGYIDNYRVAFPILRRAGVPATFFLISGKVGSAEPPWWDAIAYVVRNAVNRRFEVGYPFSRRYDLEALGVELAVRDLLSAYKIQPDFDHERFMTELQAACGATLPPNDRRLFLDWSEAKEMVAAGMSIGSHSQSHRILARLPLEQQRHEAVQSRAEIEARLGTPVLAFAYPVGRSTSFSPDSERVVAEAGYKLAFSFNPGINQVGCNPYALKRLDPGLTGDHRAFRGRLALAAALRR